MPEIYKAAKVHHARGQQTNIDNHQVPLSPLHEDSWKIDKKLDNTTTSRDDMADPTHTPNSPEEDLHKGDGLFGRVGKVIPYFRKRRNVLIFKLDIMLLLWMFVAGVS
jgi:hypothetical protein